MPTYDYRCQGCGHEFEEFQSMTAKPLRKCPACGKMRLKRLIGAGAGIIFKGSGFYETDYRSEGYKKAQKADSDTASDKKGAGKTEGKSDSSSGNQSDTKAESKPEKKTENKSDSGGSKKTETGSSDSK